MGYKPKTEEELQIEGLLPDGEYDFQIIEAVEKVSKAGNEMWVLKHTVYDKDGSTHFITAFITFGNNYGERMLRHAADACGILEIYSAGKLKVEDFVHKTGRAEIGKRQDDKLTWWNTIKDYVRKDVVAKPAEKKAALDKDLDDEIPF